MLIKVADSQSEVPTVQQGPTFAAHARGPSDAGRPLIVGVGGTSRSGSSSEKALTISLRAAAVVGAEALLISGPELNLPMYNPGEAHRTEAAQRLIEAFRRCDNIIIASPGYHGSVSGLSKTPSTMSRTCAATPGFISTASLSAASRALPAGRPRVTRSPRFAPLLTLCGVANAAWCRPQHVS